MFEELRMARCILLLVGLVAAAALVHVTFNVLRFSQLHADSGYYLAVASRMIDGAILYRDVVTGYPPLVFYIASFVGKYFVWPGEYTGYLALSWGCVIASGTLVSLIVFFKTSSRPLAFSIGSFLPLAAIQFEGIYFLLEPFVMFFALVSFVLALRREAVFIFLAGVAAGCAFMCKQYRLGILPSICLLAWTANEDRRFRNVVLVLTAFLLSTGLTLTYIVLSSGVTLAELLAQLFPTYASLLTTPYKHFTLSVVILLPLVLIAVILLRHLDFRSDRIVIALFVAVVGFMPQFYFRQYNHYMLLPLPFIIALWGVSFHYIATRRYDSTISRTVAPLILSVFSAIFILYCYEVSISVAVFLNANKPRLQQLATSTKISAVIPRSARVVLLADPVYYFLCRLLPPQDRVTGYGFLENYSAHVIAELIEKAEWVVLSPRDSYLYDRPVSILKKSGSDIFKLLEKLEFRHIKTVQDDIQIWKKQSAGIVQ